ncbi:hypothetical protein H6F50_24885 [Coleofasciculus sp. FACHB-712]|uniref:hypothetical protein n=1 Tax=Coleofasciculus sp. FACHB-712 TaxID=2692789 RepID=UPI001683F63F|nr:hypothetical protein [Coleofasciculus sp. FACHB-712]MBD1945546.1 hypothetical protein [Coleofasciculus sp. FACHB-712]
MKRKKALFVVMLIASIAFLGSIFLRTSQFSVTNDIQNLDASYHVLLTVKALTETPWSIHHGLPIVSLGELSDKYIPWGAAVPDSQGNYYYTSFGSLGFLGPYMLFQASGASLSLFNLMQFNLGIHYLGTVLLILLIWNSLSPLISSTLRLSVSTLFAALLYLFSLESLYSHGVIYWHHSLWNIVWLGQLLCLQRLIFMQMVQTENKPLRHSVRSLYLCLAFISPMLEWTGFIGNISLAFLPVFLSLKNQKINKKPRFLSKEILLSTFSSVVFIFWHYASVVGTKSFMEALQARFFARSLLDTKAIFEALLFGYFQSFGGLTLLIFAISFIFIIWKIFSQWSQEWYIFSLILFPSILVVVENIIMLQHASIYHFDRLKAIIPIILLISGFIGLVPITAARFVSSILVISLALNIHGFQSRIRESDISYIFKDNETVLKKLENKVQPCALWATQSAVRGWVNFTLDRGVHEGIPNAQALINLVDAKQACQGVLLTGSLLRNSGIYHFQSAHIYQPLEQKIYTLEPLGIWSTTSSEADFYLSDQNWERGIARNFAGFFVPNRKDTVQQFIPGRLVVFKNGETRKILSISPSGIYLNVVVDGKVLSPDQVGLPSEFTVIDIAK